MLFRLCRNWWLLWLLRRVIFPVPVILNLFAADLFVLIFGIFFLHSRLWHQHHDHLAPVQIGRSFDLSDLANQFGKMLKAGFAVLGVSEFALPKHAGHFDFVAVLEKLDCVSRQVTHIVFCDTRTYLYTL